MPLIVVGGQASKIGKTSVVTAILRRFSEFAWIAVKTTPHQHRPSACELVASGDQWRIWKQISASSDSDTGRFLVAGAKTALLLEAEDTAMQTAAAALQAEFAGGSHVLIESSRIADYIHPDLFLMLLSADCKESKAVPEQRLERADILFIEGDRTKLPWNRETALRKKAVFGFSLPLREDESWFQIVAEKMENLL
jgi:molybdopterin-guanine dinucleotide biosynthesis protein